MKYINVVNLFKIFSDNFDPDKHTGEEKTNANTLGRYHTNADIVKKISQDSQLHLIK